VATAAATKAWAATVENPTESDYLANLKALLAVPAVRYKNVGYVVSSVQAYLKAMSTPSAGSDKSEWSKKVEASKYLGEVGEKIEFTACITGRKTFDSAFGATELIKLTTPEGQELVWWTSSNPQFDGEVKLVAVVKKTEDYKGLKQTTVTRVKPRVEKATKTKKARA